MTPSGAGGFVAWLMSLFPYPWNYVIFGTWSVMMFLMVLLGKTK